MFYGLSKKNKQLAFWCVMLACYFLLSALFGLQVILGAGAQDRWIAFFTQLVPLWWVKILLSMTVGYLLVYLQNNGLDFSSTAVGDGQHGSARFMKSEEVKQAFNIVPFGRETVPGLVVGARHKKKQWLIDSSDHTMLILAPPGGGKTTCQIIPTIYYNAMVMQNTGKAASMIITDNKGDLYRQTNAYLKTHGIQTKCLDFRHPLQSMKYNLMHSVNQHIDRYLSADTENSKLAAYGKAEQYAKILADMIVNNLDTPHHSEASAYFNNTAKGLLISLILLVSEHGEANQRHIISVFRMIMELSGTTEASSETNQQNKLEALLSHVDHQRLLFYAGGSVKADVRTSMNISSSALEKLSSFIDAELEQMVCSHSEGLDAQSFVSTPTAIFLICPDENTTRHFFASLFIRTFSNELLELASDQYGGRFPMPVFNLWDEFGNMPPVKDIDVLFSAVRSRNIRFVIAIQSFHQLEKSYTKTKALLIRDTCQITLFTATASGVLSTAKELSDILGKQTVLSGSVSQGRGVSTTRQMVGKPLLSPDQIITLSFGQWIVLKSGAHPMKSELPRYDVYLPPLQLSQSEPIHTEIIPIDCVSPDDILENLLHPCQKNKKSAPRIYQFSDPWQIVH